MQHHHQRAQCYNSQRVAQRIGNPQPHPLLPALLNGSNVGDRCKMVVIKTMPQSEHGAGEESEFELPIHPLIEMWPASIARAGTQTPIVTRNWNFSEPDCLRSPY